MSQDQPNEQWHADKLARRLVETIGRRSSGQPMGRFIVAIAAATHEIIRQFTPADRLPAVLDMMAHMMSEQARLAREKLTEGAAKVDEVLAEVAP